MTERHREYRNRLWARLAVASVTYCAPTTNWQPYGVGCAGLRAIGLKEIEKIFAVTEALGLSREAVVIPLRTATPGTLRILSNRKLEIVVDGGIGFEQWLSGLEGEIRRLMNLEAD